MAESNKKKILTLAEELGILRPRGVVERKITKEVLRRMLAEGLLERPEKGL